MWDDLASAPGSMHARGTHAALPEAGLSAAPVDAVREGAARIAAHIEKVI